MQNKCKYPLTATSTLVIMVVLNRDTNKQRETFMRTNFYAKTSPIGQGVAFDNGVLNLTNWNFNDDSALTKEQVLALYDKMKEYFEGDVKELNLGNQVVLLENSDQGNLRKGDVGTITKKFNYDSAFVVVGDNKEWVNIKKIRNK
jgi:hypothetical protein